MATVPRISLLLLACNQERTVRAAIQSCLAQECEALEIVISDDASADETFRHMREAAADYKGPHQVRVRRNEKNLGIGAHYNALIAETSGALIVTAAGDDISLPQRVCRLAQAWDNSGQTVDLISSDCIHLSLDDRLGDYIHDDDLGSLTLADWTRRAPFTVGATHAFTRRVMQRFGAFIDGLWYEDRIMVFPALMSAPRPAKAGRPPWGTSKVAKPHLLVSGGAITLKEPLVHYRTGGTSKLPHIQSAERLLRWTGTQNQRVLAEIAQLVQDARVAGCEAEVAESLAPTLRRETYIRAMLDAPGIAKRWRHVVSSPQLPLAWRLRKLVNLTWPSQSAGLKRLKARLRRPRPHS